MAKYFYNFSDRSVGAFTNGNGMTNITAGPGGKTRSIVEYLGGKLFRIVQGSTNGQDLTAFDTLNNHGNDTESLVLFSVNAASQVPGSYGVSFWDYTAANQGLSLGFLPASSVKSLILYDDKAATTVNFMNFDWANNQKYWLRWRVEGGNNHFIRIWQDGTTEPTSWSMTSTYSNRTTGNHYMGLGSYTANATVDFYQATFGTNGDTAPATKAEYDSYVNSTVPTSTPQVGYAGGYGGSGGYGRGYGEATLQSALNVPLSVANALHSHTTSSILISQTHILGTDSALHSNVAATVTLTQLHNALVDSSTHSVISTSPTIVEAKSILIDSSSHSLTSDDIASIVQAHLLATDNASHSHAADPTFVSQVQVIIASDSSLGTGSTSPTLIESLLLNKPDDAMHTITDSGVLVTQVYTLLADGTVHSLKSNEIAKIFDWTELGKDFGIFIPGSKSGGTLSTDSAGSSGILIPSSDSSGVLEKSSTANGIIIPANIEKGKL